MANKHPTVRAARDRGAATIVVVMGLALGLVAMTVLLSRIAHANDLRTQAQSGADAAALGAVAEIRDRAARTVLGGQLPDGIVYLDKSAESARRYAQLNETTATSVVPSGFYGHTVKVEVRSDRCQTKYEPNQPFGRIPCRQGDRDVQRGTAVAYASVTFPTCMYTATGVECDGRTATTMDAARDLFEVRLVDKADAQPFVPGSFTSPDSAGVPTAEVAPGAGNNRRLGQQLAAQHGWTGAQWQCLDQLWQHESGWNHRALNQSSGAYGITQALPPGKMAAFGADWRTNPVPQIRWGLSYIGQRYGSPCGAWAWWQRTDPRPYPGHWY
ncbi:MAG TPA: hypothetical protein VH912_21180 [Streptosporangiaceae bacterium]|nr:hypothetical protein [Gaiellales bacterium]